MAYICLYQNHEWAYWNPYSTFRCFYPESKLSKTILINPLVKFQIFPMYSKIVMSPENPLKEKSFSKSYHI